MIGLFGCRGLCRGKKKDDPPISSPEIPGDGNAEFPPDPILLVSLYGSNGSLARRQSARE